MKDTSMNGDVSVLSIYVQITENAFKTQCKQSLRGHFVICDLFPNVKNTTINTMEIKAHLLLSNI